MSNFTTVVYRDSLNVAIIKNVVTVVLCIFINFINGTLVHTFRKHQVFNMNPRYILYIHLVLNDMILLTIFTLIMVLSYIVYTLNISFCMFLLSIGLLSTANNPFTLAVMAVECYIAVCFPLRHSLICTVRKTYAVIGLMWLIGLLTVLPDIFYALATESLDFFRSRMFCLSANVFRNPVLKERRDVSNIVCLVIIWLTIFYTYFRIMCVAKAADTCLLMSNFTTVVYRDSLNVAIIKNVVTVVLCIFINFINGTLVHTFRKHQVFNMNPRYILYVHLVLNDMILLTTFTLVYVLSYIVYTLNVSFCMFLLSIAILSNVNNPFTLAVMAVEHSLICTVQKTYAVIGLMWLIGLLTVLPDIFNALATESLDFFRSRVFCFSANVFRNPVLKERRDVSNIVAVRTIRFIISILIHVLPRLISPLVYGLRDKMFRKYLRKYLPS
ncbi:hypothetical protein KUCAC02_030364 [Chaenocephalus aceratus]|uniref:Uncharacterized protein n=1 Tax=Chaenocephalus aceratus TaxID=36190 RepID=A0ACB9XKK5_CHAAC|nr:hypothetical protein KUCAC02_030364 [Chaenocephalus aceratus]